MNQPTLTAARVGPSAWAVRARKVVPGDCFHDGHVVRQVMSEPITVGWMSVSCRVREETGRYAGNEHQAFIDLRY